MTTTMAHGDDGRMQLEASPEGQQIATYARSGDEAALDAVLRARWPEAIRFATRVLGDPAAAEDAAQEAFINLARAARAFDPEKPFEPWFRAILVNSVRRSSRARGRWRRREEVVARRAPDRHTGTRPLDAVDLAEHLARLPVDLRLPLVLHYYEGRPHPEVAAAVGCPVGTASSRIRRGLERLKESLSRGGYACGIAAIEAALSAPSLPSPAGQAPSARGIIDGARRFRFAPAVAAPIAAAAVLVALLGSTILDRSISGSRAPGTSARASVAIAVPDARATGSNQRRAAAAAWWTPEDAPSDRKVEPVPVGLAESPSGTATAPAHPAPGGSARIVGKVIGAGASVFVSIIPDVPGSMSPVSTRLEEGGRFSLEGVAPGTARVSLNHRGFEIAGCPVEVPEAGEVDCGVFYLETHRITGRVTGPDGQVVHGAWVGCRPEGAREGGATTGELDDKTDVDGTFEFASLGAGRWILTAGTATLTALAAAEVDLAADDVHGIEIHLAAGGAVRVTLEGPCPRVADGVRLSARPIAPEDGLPDPRRGSNVELDLSKDRAKGGATARLEGLGPGEWAVALAMHGLSVCSANVHVDVGREASITFPSLPRGRAEVRVQAPAQALVAVYSGTLRDGPSGARIVRATCNTGDDAAALFTELPEGPLGVLVSSYGVASFGESSFPSYAVFREGIDAPAGETVTVDLAPPDRNPNGAWINGAVESDVPVPVLCVGEGSIAIAEAREKDGPGRRRFSFWGMTPGRCRLFAARDLRSVPGRVVEVAVEAGRASPDEILVPPPVDR